MSPAESLWLPRAAVSHWSADRSGYDPPVASTNAADDRTQLSADAIQFGFCVYEGMRAYLRDDHYLVFRARDHHRRLEQSCAALAMPCPGYETFLDAIKLVVEGNHDGTARRLYLRPIVYSGGGGIMPQQARSYTYAVLCTTFDPVVGSLKVFVEPTSRRTVPAFSAVKTATNYTSSALATRRAQDEGYDTVLWLDGDGYLQECTTMNVFVHMNGEIVTPRLGRILPGVTRRTLIELLAEQERHVVEKDLHISELVSAIADGHVSGIVTTSTALGINNVASLRYRDDEVELGAEWPDAIAAAGQAYRVVTEDFPVGLLRHPRVAESSYVGTFELEVRTA
jgi:branched-chain amino acid aminotransferase